MIDPTLLTTSLAKLVCQNGPRFVQLLPGSAGTQDIGIDAAPWIVPPQVLGPGDLSIGWPGPSSIVHPVAAPNQHWYWHLLFWMVPDKYGPKPYRYSFNYTNPPSIPAPKVVMPPYGEIDSIAVYILTGGPDDETQTAWNIYSWDEDSGAPLGVDFVDVVSNPSLTAGANAGLVPTYSPPYGDATIQARDTIGGLTFSHWAIAGVDYSNPKSLVVPPTNSLHVKSGTSGAATAWYSRGPDLGPTEPNIYNPWWWLVSNWGRGPDTGPGISMRQVTAALALSRAADSVSPELRSSVLQIAAKELSIAVSAIEKEIKAAQKGR